MRYFIDTEFIERGPKHPLELISIGIVADDGRELYRVSTDFKARHASSWVKANVLPHLPDRDVNFYDSPRRRMGALQWQPNDRIAQDILAFIGDDPSPEFWGYYCAYDWVVFCQLFGDMSRKPPHFPYYCRDLKQAIDEEDWGLSSPPSQPDDAPHDALCDARWVRTTWGRHFSAHPAYFADAAS